MSLLLDIAPSDLGLPPKFASYRPTQADAIDYIQSSSARIVALAAPTGVGKSLVGVTTALAAGLRTVYLTATKGLQNQILEDFTPSGMVDIRGLSNYPCRVYTTKLRRNVSCEVGDAHGCSLRNNTGCPYFQALECAKDSSLIATNYSYWLHARRSSPTALCRTDGPPVDLLICDEAHDAMEELGRFLQIAVPLDELDEPPSPGDSGLMSEASGSGWKTWAAARAKGINDELTRIRTLYASLALARAEEPRYAELENLKKKLSAILLMDSNWCWEAAGQSVLFDAIWPGRYSSILFSGVPRVLLLSATLRPYTLSLLGLQKDEYDFKEFSNGWPPNRGLVYFLPTAKLGYRSTAEDYARIVERIDEIVAARLDRKGIVHTVSYERMRLLLARSKYARYMYYHDKAADAVSTARRFRAASPPAILISPSYATGWDFAYDQCEYQIIPKVPFAYSQSRVMRERLQDTRYRYYCAALELVQMVGRGRRAADDRCETFILDTNFAMVQAFGKSFFPDGFRVYKQNNIPHTPEKIVHPLARIVPEGLS